MSVTMMGAPRSGRYATRSKRRPTAAQVRTVSTAAASGGAWSVTSSVNDSMPPSMYTPPWAMWMIRRTPYVSDRPIASRA